MVKWLLGIVPLLAITAACVGWYWTYDYVNNGWREYRFACRSMRIYEIESPLKPEVFDEFSQELSRLWPGAIKTKNNKIYIRPYIPLFDPQNYAKGSGVASAKVLNKSKGESTWNCLPHNIKMLQDPEAKRTILPYEDHNEWLRILTFSPRQHWHRLEAAAAREQGGK